MKMFLALLLLSLPIAGYSLPSPGLTAVFDSKKNIVKLKWQHNDRSISKFILQRSSDNSRWTDIYTLIISSSTEDKFVRFTDEKVGTGKNYYRLKMYTDVSVFEYTPSIMVIIGKPGGNSWLMYPVPVGTTLNLQYNGSELIPGVITITIQSLASGTIFTRLRLASTTRFIQIPVANIGRGIYDIRIYINNEVVWNQRFTK
ncbi:MAG: Por secretion system C-terminal sorting protein [Ferruginibacter sp.]|nr:Por secretion system C-terminal sorting protein [Ferruginibacter sp.]